MREGAGGKQSSWSWDAIAKNPPFCDSVFDKLIQVLRFGCGYEAIVDATCSASTIRNRIQPNCRHAKRRRRVYSEPRQANKGVRLVHHRTLSPNLAANTLDVRSTILLLVIPSRMASRTPLSLRADPGERVVPGDGYVEIGTRRQPGGTRHVLDRHPESQRAVRVGSLFLRGPF